MKKCVAQYDPDYAERHDIFLVSFANGLINCGDDSTLNFQSYENLNTEDGLRRKKTRKILVGETGRLQYVGYNFGPDSSRSSGLCRFYVGLLNKRTKKMRIINAQHYKMQPLFETYAAEDFEEEKSIIEKADLLTGAFGSKKRRKAMEARHRYSLHSADLEEATKTAISEGKDLSQMFDTSTSSVIENHSEAIPPQNKDATKPEDVYNIFDIIPEDEYDALFEIAQTFTTATISDVTAWKKDERFTSYVLEHVSLGARRKGVSQDTAKKLCYFVFLTYMIQLKSSDLRKKDILSDVPDLFRKRILDKFTIAQTYESGKKQRNFPQRLKDKVLANILVLALFLDDFHVNLTELQKTLKVPIARLTAISHALGCHVKSARTADKLLLHHAELKMPLYVKKSLPKKRKQK